MKLAATAAVAAAAEQQQQPAHILVQHHARHCQQLAKLPHIDAAGLILRKVDAGLLEQLNRVLRIHVV